MTKKTPRTRTSPSPRRRIIQRPPPVLEPPVSKLYGLSV